MSLPDGVAVGPVAGKLNGLPGCLPGGAAVPAGAPDVVGNFLPADNNGDCPGVAVLPNPCAFVIFCATSGGNVALKVLGVLPFVSSAIFCFNSFSIFGSFTLLQP